MMTAFLIGAIIAVLYFLIDSCRSDPAPDTLEKIVNCNEKIREVDDARIKNLIDIDRRKAGLFPQEEIDAMKCQLKEGETLEQDQVTSPRLSLA